MIILLIWTVVLVAATVIYFRQAYSRFKRYGVKYNPPLPFVGNSARVLLRLDHVTEDIIKMYTKFREERFVGKYEFSKELIVIHDPELVKQITVKDFEHFLDHRSIFGDGDSFLSRSLVSLKGQEWKDMRSTLSPAFTSSKIRVMVPFMVEIGDQMIEMLKTKINESETGSIEIDTRDLTTRYANDVIASCAFGLRVDSHAEPNNQFYERGKETTTFTFRHLIMFIFMFSFPKIAKMLNIDFPSKGVKDFFTTLVLGTMKNREEKNIIRPDMIHLLMEAKKGKLTHESVQSNDVAAGFATVEESTIGRKEINRARDERETFNLKGKSTTITKNFFLFCKEKEDKEERVNRKKLFEMKRNEVWTDKDLTAQAMLFFIAGFETVSVAMSFLLYELAVNPEVQDRLAKEIKEHDVKNGGKFDFTSIQNMTYLDMVTSELLRLWPPGIALDRECIKDYNLGKPNKNADKDFILRKGTGIQLPTFAFHRDPQYFPDPLKFDPERFSDENKHKINPFVYMPFGLGPRNCIGSRFALCEMKIMTYQILRHLEISPTETTCIPARMAKDSFNFRLEGGHNLKFRLRA